MLGSRIVLALLCATATSVGAARAQLGDLPTVAAPGPVMKETRLPAAPEAGGGDVTVVTRVMAMPKALAESFMTLTGFQKNAAEEGDPAVELAFLNERQVRGWLDLFQRDHSFNLMQAPKITTFSGQQGEIKIGEEMIIPVLASPASGGTADSAEEKTFVGVDGKCLPVVSADRKFVRLQLDWRIVSLQKAAEKQALDRVSLKSTVAIPSQGTVVFRLCSRTCERCETVGPPVISKIPYMNRLFTNCGYHKDEDVYFVMFTSTILPKDSAVSDGER